MYLVAFEPDALYYWPYRDFSAPYMDIFRYMFYNPFRHLRRRKRLRNFMARGWDNAYDRWRENFLEDAETVAY